MLSMEVERLRTENKKKLILDKRKLKFASDQLKKYESRMNNYGIGGLA